MNINFFAGLTLEEMDDVFGATDGLAAADQARQDVIHRRLGLVHDSATGSEKKDEESIGHEEDVNAATK